MKEGTNKKKSRIAMIGVGQIGGGKLGDGVPVLFAMIRKVCVEFDVSFYSLIPVEVESKPIGLTIYPVSKSRMPLYFKYIVLLLKIIWHHLLHPFSIVYAVSAFPAGRMAIVLSWILRRPVVVHLIADEMVSIPEINYGELLDQRRRRINEWVCNQADEVIVLSDYQREIVSKNLLEQREIKVLPLRTDIDKFTFVARTLSYPIQFIHIAYYHPVKDQKTLFNAFALIAKEIDCVLTVIGDGFEIPQINILLKELGIIERVFFKGMIRHDQVSNIFEDKHILLQTSRYEAEGAVAMEAMACGVMVCGTSVGFLADYGKDLAVVVPTADPNALAVATMKLIQQPSDYYRLRLNARKYIEEHSSDWSSQAYIELFTELTS